MFSSCTIKKSPQDFQVFEIDSNNHDVSSSGYCLASTDGDGAAHTTTTSVPPCTKRDLNLMRPPNTRLEELIGDAAIVSALQELANNCTTTKRVCLGTFDDKTARASLRRCVRWHHPQLVTALLDQGTLEALRDADVFPSFASCLGVDNAEQLVRASMMDDDAEPFSVQWPILASCDKDDRRLFHANFHKACSKLHCRVEDGIASITPKRGAKRPRTESTSTTKHYTLLVVEKVNIEAQRMKELIATCCGVEDGQVGVAGTKDRRAVTVQRVSVAGGAVPAHASLPHCIHDTEDGYVRVLQSAVASKPLSLGELQGNRFVISASCALTDPLTSAMSIVELRRRLDTLSVEGMLNYFGAQRFGRTMDLPGMALLRDDWCGAVTATLASAPDALQSFQCSGNVTVLVRSLNPRTHRDAHMMADCLHQVAKQDSTTLGMIAPEDIQEVSARWVGWCKAAVMRVPFHMRQLWMHAAQSLIFNLTLEALHANGDPIPATLPLVGSEFALEVDVPSSEPWRTTLLRVLHKERVALHILQSKAVAGVPFRGSVRDSLVKPTDCSLDASLTDDGDVTMRVAFVLPSSAYATVLLKQLTGCDPVDFAK